MNLLKLFNFKYFMQNIKKSKMAIILFLSIVPIFTALTIITLGAERILEFYELGLANIICMYITPFILSITLFGYVYKKKSIDFIGSMPISRKTIFITNTVGGIVLILLSQFVTFIISALVGSLTNSMIFIGMLWDIFLYQTVAYIFVFTISNLAMSISGNIITQIVMTLLIIFLIPVSIAYFDLCCGTSVNIISDGYEFSNIYLRETRNYTAPNVFLSCMINNMTYEYNVYSIRKMIVLSIAYIVIGYIMFNRKVMEHAGTSFENKYIHFIVKGLTLTPFAMILVPLVEDNSWEGAIFIIAIITIYFFIYDLITNNKNKVMQNIGAMIISIAVLFGVYDVIANIGEDYEYKVDISDIKYIAVDDLLYNIENLGIKLTDKEKIENIMYQVQNSKDREKRIKLTFGLKNGSSKRCTLWIPKEVLDMILKEIEPSDFEINNIECNSLEKLDSETKKNLKIALNNALTDDNIIKICEASTNKKDTIFVYEYRNHKVRKISYPKNISKDVFNIITKIENQRIAELLKRRNYAFVSVTIDGYTYEADCNDEIEDFIISNQNVVCDIGKTYVRMNISGNNFYTNDVEAVRKLMDNVYYNKYKAYDDDIPITESLDEYTAVQMNPNSI